MILPKHPPRTCLQKCMCLGKRYVLGPTPVRHLLGLYVAFQSLRVYEGTKKQRVRISAHDISEQGVQPAARGLHGAQTGYECGPTQNRKCT